MTHTHLCEHCGELFDCEGRQTANPDGIPYLWCDRYHGDNETWCDLCLGQMLEDQAHDAWWLAIGAPTLDQQHEEETEDGET